MGSQVFESNVSDTSFLPILSNNEEYFGGSCQIGYNEPSLDLGLPARWWMHCWLPATVFDTLWLEVHDTKLNKVHLKLEPGLWLEEGNSFQKTRWYLGPSNIERPDGLEPVWGRVKWINWNCMNNSKQENLLSSAQGEVIISESSVATESDKHIRYLKFMSIAIVVILVLLFIRLH